MNEVSQTIETPVETAPEGIPDFLQRTKVSNTGDGSVPNVGTSALPGPTIGEFCQVEEDVGSEKEEVTVH